MWMVDPSLMCRQHLLGEHKELHMLVGTLLKGISVAGYINGGLAEIHSIKKRHQQLVKEMTARGYSHQSPLKEFASYQAGKVDVNLSNRELIKRCRHCREIRRIK
jgi:hypothetical protein